MRSPGHFPALVPPRDTHPPACPLVTRASPSTSTAGPASLNAFSVKGSGSPGAPPPGGSLPSKSPFSGSRAAAGCFRAAGRGRSS